ncbi:MAG: zinc dependent phospholipase C family protein [Clostridia bacterium]|nr:zinc dependent phospholipase C family protein [Clostridia bacterium]
MPDQLAHFLFARRVYEKCGDDIRRRIDVSSPAFRAGTFGPDPLFNDTNALRRREGFEMHRLSCAELMERMRPAIRRGMPRAADYAAGFFCHYALDRICHPELIRRHSAGPDRHVPMETAYDRYLFLRGERDVPHRIPLSDADCRAACEMYLSQTPESFRRNVNAYWRLRRLLLAAGGGPLSRIAAVKPAWKGIIPEKHPGEGIKSAIAMLDEYLESSVDTAAEQLERLFRSFDGETEFDPWLDYNFKGESAAAD